MISFDEIVGVLPGHMGRGGDQFVQHPEVRAGLVRGHLDRRRPVAQGTGEEPAGGVAVPLLTQQYVDDLAVLVDRPVQVPPPAGDLDVGLIDEPAVAGGVPERSGGVGEQRGEPLHPPVHRDVVDLDAALGQQLLHIPVGQPVPEVLADRHRDHLGREPEPGERRPVNGRAGGSKSAHWPSFLSPDRPPRRGLGRCNRAASPGPGGKAAPTPNPVNPPLDVRVGGPSRV